jgi:hypothetical protein
MTSDEITLTIPREQPFREVAHLVLGGFAARLQLTYESLDDLGTALEAVLERAANDGHVTVRLTLDGDTLRASVGPLAVAQLRQELDRDPGNEVNLRRILDTVVDGYSLDGDGWLELTKHVEMREDG